MRDLRIGYVSFVSGIVKNDSAIGAGIFNPATKGLSVGDSTRGIVGKAQIDQIDVAIGKLGNEIIGGVAAEINQALILAALVGLPGMPGHHVSVNIDRINRVHDRDGVVVGEDIQNIAAIAFGAVGNEDFIRRDVAAAGLEIVFGDGFAQEL